MAKGKKSQNSMAPVEKAINPKHIERLRNVDFNNQYSWLERPVSEEFLEDMARELVNWVLDEKNNLRPYSLTNFTRPKRLRRSILNEWAAKNETFKKALEFAKEAIGSRCYDLRVEHRFDEKQFLIHQGEYDPDFDAAFKKYNDAVRSDPLKSGSNVPEVIKLGSP